MTTMSAKPPHLPTPVQAEGAREAQAEPWRRGWSELGLRGPTEGKGTCLRWPPARPHR